MPEKMQALVVNKPGGPEVLQLREVCRPRLRDELDVLIRVKAAGINPADWQNRKNGAVYDSEGGSPSGPTILGIDGVGVVVEAGRETTNVRVGDEVWYVDGGYAGNPGSYAEYKVVRSDYVTAKPGTLDFAEAAALPVVALIGLGGGVRQGAGSGKEIISSFKAARAGSGTSRYSTLLPLGQR